MDQSLALFKIIGKREHLHALIAQCVFTAQSLNGAYSKKIIVFSSLKKHPELIFTLQTPAIALCVRILSGIYLAFAKQSNKHHSFIQKNADSEQSEFHQSSHLPKSRSVNHWFDQFCSRKICFFFHPKNMLFFLSLRQLRVHTDVWVATVRRKNAECWCRHILKTSLFSLCMRTHNMKRSAHMPNFQRLICGGSDFFLTCTASFSTQQGRVLVVAVIAELLSRTHVLASKRANL